MMMMMMMVMNDDDDVMFYFYPFWTFHKLPFHDIFQVFAQRNISIMTLIVSIILVSNWIGWVACDPRPIPRNHTGGITFGCPNRLLMVIHCHCHHHHLSSPSLPHPMQSSSSSIEECYSDLPDSG